MRWHLSTWGSSDKAPRLPGLVLLMIFSGCNTDGCDTSGFDQLGAKEPRAVGFPGDKIAEVESYTPLRALGRDGDLVAIAGANADDELVLVPVDGGPACTATGLKGDKATGSAALAALEDLIAVLESPDDSGLGRVTVYDARCATVAEFDNARPLLQMGRLVPYRMLLLAEGDQLVTVDPVTRRTKVVDEEVAFVEFLRDEMVVVTAGQLIVRDVALQEQRRLGKDVTEIAIGPTGEQIAYVDAGKLHLMSSVRADPQALDDEVCGVGFADQPRRAGDGPGRYVSYYSPCQEQTLKTYDLEQKQEISVGAATSPRAAARYLDGADLTAIFFERAAEEGAEYPTLWVKLPGEKAVALGAGPVTGVGRVDGDGVPLFLAEDGNVVRWTGAETPEVLVSEVVRFEVSTAPERALVRAGDNAVLTAVEGYDKPKAIAERGLDLGLTSANLLAFGEDVSGLVGDLRLLDTESGRIETVARRAFLPVTNIAFTGETLFYLENYDEERGVGDLCMRVVASADTFCTADVSDFRVLIRPKRSVAYVKRSGDRELLYWARVE